MPGRRRRTAKLNVSPKSIKGFVLKRAVKVYFERKKLVRRLRRKERRVLFRAGFWGRAYMRRLIRRRKKKISPPGQPPFAHAIGAVGMKDVRFEVELSKGRVVFGHRKYPKKKRINGGVAYVISSFKPVPQLLNEGGLANQEISFLRGGGKSVPMVYRARPFREQTRNAAQEFMQRLMYTERL